MKMRQKVNVWLLVAAVLALAASAEARGKIQGWCQDGNISVTIPGTQGSGSQKFQRSYSACTVTVYNAGTVTLSTIYSNSTGTAKANPFTAAASGQWFFYANPGSYDVRLSGGGIPAPFTLGDQYVGNAPVFNVSNFTGADLGAKIASCVTALPTTGGVCDARGFLGANTVTSGTITLGSATKPVRLLLPAGTISSAANPVFSVPGASFVVGHSQLATTITATAANSDVVSWTGSGGGMSDLTISTSGGRHGLVLDATGVAGGGILYNTFERMNLVGSAPTTGTGILLRADTASALVADNNFRSIKINDFTTGISVQRNTDQGPTDNFFQGFWINKSVAGGTGISLTCGDLNHFFAGLITGWATGLSVSASVAGNSVNYNTFHGIRFESNTTNISDAGASTSFFGISTDTNTVTIGANAIYLGTGNAAIPQQVNLGQFTFANLGTPSDGSVRQCSDCQMTSYANSLCAAGGGGAIAFRQGGAWRCGPPEFLPPAIYNSAGTLLSPNALWWEDSVVIGGGGFTDAAWTGHSFPTTYMCTCADQNAAAACGVSHVDASTVRVRGTVGNTVQFICVGR